MNQIQIKFKYITIQTLSIVQINNSCDVHELYNTSVPLFFQKHVYNSETSADSNAGTSKSNLVQNVNWEKEYLSKADKLVTETN